MFRFIAWLIWDFTGLRFIFRKLLPLKYDDTEGRPPSTLVIWLIVIYLISFAIASHRYENRVDIIEYRANAIFDQLSSPDMRKYALSRIATVQNMPCPNKPRLLEPQSIFNSLFHDQTYPEMVELLKKTVEDLKEDLDSADLSNTYLVEADLQAANLKKTNLNGANLQKAQLNEANLWEANLDEAILNEANLFRALVRRATLRKAKLQNANLKEIRFHESNLREADLHKADLSGAYLNEAILIGANLRETNLMDAYLSEADLTGADLSNAVFTRTYFKEAILTEAKLKNAVNLTVEELCEASSLYKAELDPNLEKKVKVTCPELLEKPEWVKE